MIEQLRRRMGRKVMWAVLGVTFLAMGGMGLIGLLFKRFSQVPPNRAAEVNGYEITQRDLMRKRIESKRNAAILRQFLGMSTDEATIEKQALDSLIHQELLAQLANSMGIYLDPSYISKQLQEPMFLMRVMGDYVPPQLMTREGINFKQLIKALRAQGVPAQCFEDVLSERLKGQVVTTMLSASAYVPKKMVLSAYNQRFRPRIYRIATISIEPYEKKATAQSVDEAVLKQFYTTINQRARYYWKPERRIGIVWNFSHVKDTFKGNAQAALAKGVQAFKTFVENHKGIESPISVNAGKRNDLLSRKLFTLGVGQYGIETEKDKHDQIKGYIIKLEKAEPTAPEPFGDVKDRVKNDYNADQGRKLLADDLEKLKGFDTAKREAWIAEHNAPTEKTGMLSPQQTGDWIAFSKRGIDRNRLMMMNNEGEVMTVLSPAAGYLVTLLAFGPIDQKEVAARYQDLIMPLFHEAGMRVVSSFIASLEKNATIIINDSTNRK